MADTKSFGAWLKQQRRARDLTQAELAEQVGCALVTLKRIEQNMRRPGKQMVARLLECLAIPSTERPAISLFARTGVLEGAARPAPSAEAPAEQPGAAPLPVPPTRLIGRAADVAYLTGQLRQPDVRLITLVGPPGVGKTRLALQVGLELGGAFPDGVAFVPLSAISDPALLPSAIIDALEVAEGGAAPDQQLLGVLRDQRKLLVLDNFEQIGAASAFVAQLLTRCRKLAILVTSRTPLHLRGEWEYPVKPLPVPEEGQPAAASAVEQAPAVALFVERARQKQPAFSVTEQNSATIVALCRQLDGLPLALELAAAWVSQFALPALLARLQSSLALLASSASDRGERHQTLTSAISWSYAALGRQAQELFTRLSAFVGGCDLAAVGALYEAEEAGLDLRDVLFALTNRQLVQQEPGPSGEPRYSMLMTIREYARELLASSQQAETIARRHAHYYTGLAVELEPQLTGPDQVQCLDRLEAEQANLRAAWSWLLEHGEDERALELTGALGRFWLIRGHFAEGRRWLHATLGRPALPQTSSRAKVLKAAGTLAHASGELAEATRLLAEALTLYQDLDDWHGSAACLNNLAIVATTQRRYRDANDYCLEALALVREGGSAPPQLYILSTLGSNMFALGEYEQATRYYEEALAMAAALDDIQAHSIIRNNLGEVALVQGHYQRAISLCKASLARAREHGFNHLLAFPLITTAKAHYCRAMYRPARKHCEEGLAVAREVGEMSMVIESLVMLGYLALEDRQAVAMDELFREALVLSRAHGSEQDLVQALAGGAVAAMLLKRSQQGLLLFEGAEHHQLLLGVPETPFTHIVRAKFRAVADAVCQTLDPAAYARLCAAAAQLSLEQLVAALLDPSRASEAALAITTP